MEGERVNYYRVAVYSAAQLERIAMSKEGDLPMDAYFHVIGTANIKAMEELSMQRKKSVILSEKLDAYFTEKYGSPWINKGIAIGEAKGKAESVLTVLRTRFEKGPREVEQTIREITDPVALDSWTACAATCQSLDDFVTALK